MYFFAVMIMTVIPMEEGETHYCIFAYFCQCIIIIIKY